MGITNYGTRYLEHKTFLKLCTDLEINSLGFKSDERWLELLEKEKILFPLKRITYPRTYKKFVYKMRYSQESVEVPEKYRIVYELSEKIKNFQISKSLFHIFDKNKPSYRKYIKEPSKRKFIPWKNYDFKVGKYYGLDEIISDTDHYYGYWQTYYFYEIIKACTLKYMINVFDEETQKELWKTIPVKKIFGRSLPFKYDKNNGDYLRQAKYFDILSFYIETKYKLGNFVFRRIAESVNEERRKRYNILEKKIAPFVIKRYNISEKELYEFLTFLCKKYDEYKKNKEEKLVEMLKLDISSWLTLIIDGLHTEFDQVNKKLGRVISDFRNTLDVIFPKPFAEERENVLYTLKSALTSDLNFYKPEDVDKEKVEEFLRFLEANNLELFYYSLGQINDSFYRDTRIYVHIFYLSLLFENVLKIIGRSSLDTEIVDFFNSSTMIKKSICKFFNKEDWVPTIRHEWENYTTFSPSLDLKTRLFVEIEKTTFSKNGNNNSAIKMLLTSGLARNLSAHEHSKVFTNDSKIILCLLNNVVAAIWFTWEYALDKGFLKTSK